MGLKLVKSFFFETLPRHPSLNPHPHPAHLKGPILLWILTLSVVSPRSPLAITATLAEDEACSHYGNIRGGWCGGSGRGVRERGVAVRHCKLLYTFGKPRQKDCHELKASLDPHVQQAEALAAKPRDPSLIPETHVVKGFL